MGGGSDIISTKAYHDFYYSSSKNTNMAKPTYDPYTGSYDMAYVKKPE